MRLAVLVALLLVLLVALTLADDRGRSRRGGQRRASRRRRIGGGDDVDTGDGGDVDTDGHGGPDGSSWGRRRNPGGRRRRNRSGRRRRRHHRGRRRRMRTTTMSPTTQPNITTTPSSTTTTPGPTCPYGTRLFHNTTVWECKPGFVGQEWGDPHFGIDADPYPMCWDYTGGNNHDLRLFEDPNGRFVMNVHLGPEGVIEALAVIMYPNLVVEVNSVGSRTVTVNGDSPHDMAFPRLWTPIATDLGDVTLEITTPNTLGITSDASVPASFEITITTHDGHISSTIKYFPRLDSDAAHGGVFGKVRESSVSIDSWGGDVATLTNGMMGTLVPKHFGPCFLINYDDFGVGPITDCYVASLLAYP